MCGIVGAVAKRCVANVLIDGLKRLEYRGYDSAGIALMNDTSNIQRLRTLGKVRELESAMNQQIITGQIGIAHTRWATHGEPSERNAHPHMSGDVVAVVHNGIIENHEELRARLRSLGYHFSSETDSELIAHLIVENSKQHHGFLAAVRATVCELEGAFALGIIDRNEPERLLAVRQGSPLVIGVGDNENFIASDHIALLSVTKKFIYLEDGDIAEILRDNILILNKDGIPVSREIHTPDVHHEFADKGTYKHFMLKEIYDQPQALTATLSGRIGKGHILEEAFGENAKTIFERVKRVQIVACGTSYHAGMIARYWFEELAGVPCQVEVASEFRYRQSVVQDDTLFLTISQSGETADTLAALRQAKKANYVGTLAVCNVPASSLVRESDIVIMTRAGMEIGVASTKAFTTQLTALLMLTLMLGKHMSLSPEKEKELVAQLQQVGKLCEQVLGLDHVIQKLAERFADKEHALFLGRGTHFPVALEGALKLKEISYIHAEAYPAGELKHGPLALVDKNMPVITVAPNDELLEKLKSNLHEVRARGGSLIVFADNTAKIQNEDGITVVEMPVVAKAIAPIIYTIPLQLLAYHVAIFKGTDVDQPRNLAKSVTVE